MIFQAIKMVRRAFNQSQCYTVQYALMYANAEHLLTATRLMSATI
jgi:hypothetical protein